MQVVHERCCGLDVHKKTVVACVLLGAGAGVRKEVRTVPTMTGDLLRLGDWLASLGVTAVAMESTGIYWRPVYNLLEEGRAITLVNAQHIKAMPGRKTDVRDAEWLADLLRHGLLRPSFIPPRPIRELRELTRYRAALVGQHTAEVNRLHKVLETANLKLTSVATDVLGVSARRMLAALVAGEEDAGVLAELALGKLRAKLPELRRALEGRVKPHHRLLIEHLLVHLDFLEAATAELDAEIDRLVAPYAEATALLLTIPGIGAVTAATIIAEIGADMTRFASAKHLASWAGLCPGNHQSAGVRRHVKTNQGDAWLRGGLGEAAWAITHTKDSALAAGFHRLARRRGKPKALVALAHRLLRVIYHVLRTKTPYHELGADYLERQDADRLQRQYVRRLEHLGFVVTLTAPDAAPPPDPVPSAGHPAHATVGRFS
jgi:transposase